jgi:hypothetical protein
MIPVPVSRRDFLKQTSCGFGYLAFAAMHAEAAAGVDPLAPKPTHFPARAKRVISIFLNGGPSHLDMFDYKPKLTELNGKTVDQRSFGDVPGLYFKSNVLLASPHRFAQYGHGGIWISEILPNLARCADDLCVINSMTSLTSDHTLGKRFLHTGSATNAMPAMGSWINYGLGLANRNLPGYVVFGAGGSSSNHSSLFLPAVHTGTFVDPEQEPPINHLAAPRPADLQRLHLEHLQAANRSFVEQRQGDHHVEGMILANEQAFRMQTAVPELLDLSKESAQTLQLYGAGGKGTVGTAFLRARRLAEAGVRFIEVSFGDWDAHASCAGRMAGLCRQLDQPLAALISDLKQRGMLNETLIIVGGEFGRQVVAQGSGGRGHNGPGFTYVLAGGGVKGGYRHGATDELGMIAVEKRVEVHDLHATILHLLGLDHEKLTYRHAGRDYRLTDVHGKVVKDILA